jgi:hypothetical protein
VSSQVLRAEVNMLKVLLGIMFGLRLICSSWHVFGCQVGAPDDHVEGVVSDCEYLPCTSSTYSRRDSE